jgi:methionyl-tRNA formyltransferase
MKIVFMGTPEFARKSLKRLYEDNYNIVGVFTGADKPRNRGMKLSMCPVKELALEQNTPVFDPTALNVDTITSLNPDIIVVVAYGKILPKSILDIPPLGCVNIHGSLLPKYRGAAPIQHAILNGETTTGVTSIYMDVGMDDGDIILTKSTHIGDDDTSENLFERLGVLGSELLSETLLAISNNTAPRIPQNHDNATFAPMLKKDMSPIDWNNTAFYIKNKVRAFIPWPVATMELQGKILKVYSVEATNNQTGKFSGTIIGEVLDGLEIACADNSLIIRSIQAPNGKIMSILDYLKGNPLYEK